MKTSLLFGLITAAGIGAAHAADYALFKVCQDQRLIRTSDGAEAGHIEYIVVDPSSREVISTVVSGGVEGDRLLAIPYSSLNFAGGNEITLTEITRERLVSAPVIERTQINTAVIAPEIIERTREHFGARGEVRGEVNVPGRRGENVAPEGRNAGVNGTSRTEGRPNATAEENTNQRPPGTSSSPRENSHARSEEGNRPPNGRNAGANGENARANGKSAEANGKNAETSKNAEASGKNAETNGKNAEANGKNANAESSNGTRNASEAQSTHGRNLPSTNSRNEESPSAEGGNKTPRNANSRENTPAERAANGAKAADEPANKAAGERVKQQNEPRGAAAEEKATNERPPQGSRPEAGARSPGEAPANSPSSRAKKGEENSDAAATKPATKKSPTAPEGKEKRSDEPRSPQ